MSKYYTANVMVKGVIVGSIVKEFNNDESPIDAFQQMNVAANVEMSKIDESKCVLCDFRRID